MAVSKGDLGETIVAVRMPKTLGVRLAALAASENNYVSAVTRRLLTAALDREDAARRDTPPHSTTSRGK